MTNNRASSLRVTGGFAKTTLLLAAAATILWHSPPVTHAQACTGFPWTLEWQQCFQNMMSGVRKNTLDTIKKGLSSGTASTSSSGGGLSSVSTSVGGSRWSVKAFGLGLSTSSSNGKIKIRVSIGQIASMERKVLSDNDLRIDFSYPANSNIPPKWLTLNIVGGDATVNEVQLSHKEKEGLLFIQNS